MTGAKKFNFISVDDYLAGEEISPVKHEYIGGTLYAMVGARNVHNIIASNALATLWNRLRSSPCRPFNSDTKIRIRMPEQVRFYYPDVSVICCPNAQTDHFQDDPTVVIEVLSRGTRRTDEGEKKDAYLSIPSLLLYLLVEQDMPLVTVWRRTDQGFVLEQYKGLKDIIPFHELNTELPLAELFEDVQFAPEADD